MLGRLVPAVSVLVILLACFELLSWGLGLVGSGPGMPMPRLVIMLPNTAVGFLLCTAALWLNREQTASSLRRGASHALASVLVLWGGLTLSEYIFRVDFGVDRLLFHEEVWRVTPDFPGRSAPMTALCFCLSGLALRLLDAETPRGRRPAQLLALTIGGFASLTLLGYLYMVPQPLSPERVIFSLPPYSPMAVHTAFAFLLVSLGILCARPDRGLMRLVTADDAGGFMARRLLPAAILVPAVAGELRILGERLGLYGTAGGAAVLVVITTAILLTVIAWNATALRRLDARRREMERVYRLSEARLSGIVSNAADAIISIDEHQRITLFNEGAERIFGYSVGEVLGQKLDILLPARLRAIHTQHIRDFAAGQQVSRQMGERRPIFGMRKNGEEFSAEASISKVEVGGTRLLTVILRDDTERKRAEEALRESEERFRTAYENAPIGMALVGLDGRLVHVNRSLCEIVGYSEKELFTKTFQDITYPEDLEMDLANVRGLLQGEIDSYQIEKRYIHKKGHLVTGLLTGSLVRGSRGEPLYFIGQVQDISERKRLERDWRFLAETGPQLAGSLDPDATLTIVARLVVPALADWCVIGLIDNKERLIVMESAAASAEKEGTLRALIAAYPHEPFRHGHVVDKVVRTGEPELFPEVSMADLEAAAEDEWHREQFRRLQPLSAMLVPLVARGNTLGVILFVTSEPGRRYEARNLMLAEELARRAALAIDNARLYKRSEQATRSRDEVLRVVAHDLRSPLQAISLSARTLLKRLPEESLTERRSIDTIQRAVARSNRLIQDLLDVARMEAGRIFVERRPEELAPLLKEVLELHRALAEAKGIRLTSSVPEGSPSVLADRDRLLQIFSNLLGNALKFTPKGGQIALRVEPAGDLMLFSVSDTGPGIPAESLPHVFDPFWQAQESRKEGAGLGLAIVRGLVEAHDGRVWVESKPGVGSTFFFTLPIVAQTGEHAAHPG
jgi:PAS domain S-box-containing protein